MSRVIVITSGKGGVGKTTTTANLGTALAQEGSSVAVVDADFGLRNLDLLLGLENRVVYTAVDAIAGDCRLEQALVKDKRNPNLVLLPAAQSRDKTAVTPEQMHDIIKQLAADYDFVLVDCPAGIEQGFKNAIAGANAAIIVTTPDISAVRDADRVVGLLEAAEIESIQLILNRLRPAMVESNNMMSVEDVTEILAVPILGVVPEDPEVIVSTNKGEPMVSMSDPSYGAIAFTNITKRLLGEDIPMLDVNALNDSFMTRLKRFFTQPVF